VHDGNSRLTSVSYASGFTAKYAYTNLGHSDQMLDATMPPAAWLTGPPAWRHPSTLHRVVFDNFCRPRATRSGVTRNPDWSRPNLACSREIAVWMDRISRPNARING